MLASGSKTLAILEILDFLTSRRANECQPAHARCHSFASLWASDTEAVVSCAYANATQ